MCLQNVFVSKTSHMYASPPPPRQVSTTSQHYDHQKPVEPLLSRRNGLHTHCLPAPPTTITIYPCLHHHHPTVPISFLSPPRSPSHNPHRLPKPLTHGPPAQANLSSLTCRAAYSILPYHFDHHLRRICSSICRSIGSNSISRNSSNISNIINCTPTAATSATASC